MSFLELNAINKRFGNFSALKEINLAVESGEFICFLGPSGCGKTTLLRIIAGLEEQTSGQIFQKGQEISQFPPAKRDYGIVFQSYALFPNLTVRDNIAYGLVNQKTQKNSVTQKINSLLTLIGLPDSGDKYPNQLSGGQQQRVALARALATSPNLLLLDEPLSALDATVRIHLREELCRLQKQLGITTIMVTHDQEEALTMSDKIVVLNEGEIQQIGTPMDIYNEPENRFVADFIGASNILEGTMIEDRLVSFDGQKFECVDFGFEENEDVDIVFRPEDLDVVSVEEGKLVGVVDSILFKGVHYEIVVKTETREFIIHSTDLTEEGKTVGIFFHPEDIHVMSKMEAY